jgi:phosphoglycerol geranylgeranyltransferase
MLSLNNMMGTIYQDILKSKKNRAPGLAILIDPEEFDSSTTRSFLSTLPAHTTHLFVGGSTATGDECENVTRHLKQHTTLPVIIFPGSYKQVNAHADALLFLSLLSGRNPEYLIGQQVKAIPHLMNLDLEVIPTAYLLIDGGNESAVARVSETKPMRQDDVEAIVNTVIAGAYMGAKLVYLEAGSGALYPVNTNIIRSIRKAIDLPLIVGGGIRTVEQVEKIKKAGADMIVMGTAFESYRSTTTSLKKTIST